ncbi:hypothetical protein OF83DRAFT_665013 [Amylostereum chailletii]|nr:hypothetical protein OF83DRAFT_665013 [Amylostereum chailletii]
MPHKASDFSTSELLEALAEKLEGSMIFGCERRGFLFTTADMARLSTLLPRLQTRYLRAQNDLARVNQIPVEVLAHVFDIAKELDWGRIGDQQSGRVVHMSLVCQHWRSVALTFPSLWSTIHLRQNAIYDFQFAALCLERSKYASLRIIISTLFRGAQIAHFFAPHASRIVEVTLHLLHRHSVDTLPNYVAETCSFLAPNLRSFSLCIPMWGAEQPPPLPQLFGAPNTSVTRLHIESFANPEATHGFRRLTHLTLTSQGQHILRGPMEGFLQLLKANPTLEELFLDDAGPTIDTPYQASTRVGLPRLRLLYIQTACVEPEFPARLLDRLVLSDQCSVQVHRAVSMAGDSLHPFTLTAFPADTTHIGAFLSIDSLKLKTGKSLWLGATARHGGVTASYRLGDSAFAEIEDRQWIPAAVDAFLQVLPRPQIRSLWLAMDPAARRFGVKDCRRVLEALPSVEELTVVDDRMAEVVGLLCAEGANGAVLPAPGLISLRVVRTTRNGLDELLQLGEERKRLGCPVKQLMVSCVDVEFYERKVETLKDYFHTIKVVDLEHGPKEPDEMVYRQDTSPEY